MPIQRVESILRCDRGDKTSTFGIPLAALAISAFCGGLAALPVAAQSVWTPPPLSDTPPPADPGGDSGGAADPFGGGDEADPFSSPLLTSPFGETGGGYTTVKSIENAPKDRSPVALRGRFLRSVGSGKYIFSDPTGEIVVSVRREAFPGLAVIPRTEVNVIGTIKMGVAGIEVTADRLEF